LEFEKIAMSKPKLYVFLPLTAALMMLAACADQGTPTVAAAPAPSASTNPAPPNQSINIASSPLTVSGPLIVEHQLDVLAQREGIVVKLLSETGAHVRSGDLLAQLDDRQLEADLEAARAKTRSTDADLKNWQAEAHVLEADFSRAQKMYDAQLITREQWEHAKFKAEADQWDVKRVEQLLLNCREIERSLELELEKTHIRAPFSGIIARRYVREGQQVAKGDRLFWVTAEAPLRMRFTLPEKYLGRLKRGQQLPLTIPDFPKEEHTAKVIELSPVVDPTSGTFDGLVEVTGATGSLRPGMSAMLQIEPHQ
jgi:membrane fusion protein (multidrug efflux system)